MAVLTIVGSLRAGGGGGAGTGVGGSGVLSTVSLWSLRQQLNAQEYLEYIQRK